MQIKLKKNIILSVAVSIFLCTIILIYSRINVNENAEAVVVAADSDPYERINLNELFHIGRCLVEKAGEKIVEIRSKNDLKIKNKLADKSIVTEADLKSHQVLVDGLQFKFKHLKVISEENSDEHNDFQTKAYVDLCSGSYKSSENDHYVLMSLVNVWIDPLDATQEYSGALFNF
jgi:3'-phosphoadenosine 5'-phosphosulfate (PAPS) 3'-phosphatase